MVSLSPAPEKLPSGIPTPEQLESGSSLWSDAWHRLRKNKLAVFGACVLTVLFLLCMLLPFLPGLSYEDQNLSLTASPPLADLATYTRADQPERGPELTSITKLVTDFNLTDAQAAQVAAGESVTVDGRTFTRSSRHFLLGTDTLGRDLFARLLYGGRISITVGLVATFVALTIGVIYGATAGFFGGKVDTIMMRVVDIMYALPFTIFVILLMVFFGRNIFLLFFAIGAVEWLTMARIVRGQILSLKRMEFIEAARSLGLGSRRIIFRHMIPNVLGPIIVYTTLTIPAVMLLEAFLSFLGLGVQAPMSSWGVLIKDGAEKMEEFPWLLLFPGAVFSLTLFSLNFLGDGLRDALDVRASKD